MSSRSVIHASKSVVARSWKACAAWLIATSVAVGLALPTRLGLPSEIRVLISLVAVLCVQAFFAEFIGVRASEGEVSFPRRLLPRLGFPVFWRRRLAVGDISRVDSLDERTVRLYLDSAELLDIFFSRGEDRRRFAHCLESALRAKAPLVHRWHSSTSRRYRK
jgi:hypothetical protein